MAWAGLGARGTNVDLQKERENAPFSVEKLTHLLDGGPEKTKRRREIQSLAVKDKVFVSDKDYYFLSRTEKYDHLLGKSVHYVQRTEQLGLTPEERGWFSSIAFPFENSQIGLHYLMFLPMIERLGSEEQKKYWLPKAKNLAVIGTYAQTELGHGTHLRGLETTATFDPRTQEFVLHCPTISAMKWWPGALGKTTNHCIVMAQLYSQGKHHGLHPFVVQFRSLDNHEPLPGVTVGDIGPKFGYDAMDNGFLKFDHFRVPRDSMLMGNAEVLPDGKFRKQPSQLKRPAYAAMTLVRVSLIENMGYKALSSAATIAVRYSAVRRQSEIKPGSPEPQVLDFQTQQDKVLPHVAMAYAMKFTARKVVEFYEETQREIARGIMSGVPELHGLSAGLKSYACYAAHYGVEQCRLSCGGHGYSHASGLPKIYVHATPGCTFEGENTVMYLQAARYLVKCLLDARQGTPLARSVAYLANQGSGHVTIDGDLRLDTLVAAFQQRALRLVGRAVKRMQDLVGGGTDRDDARNLSGVDLVKAAEAHCQQFILTAFVDTIHNIRDTDLAAILTQLCQLYAAKVVQENAADFVLGGQLTEWGLDAVHARYLSLLAQLRPSAVSLVDAFDHHDVALSSILGRYDGKVYENMYEWAKRSPLNQTQVTPGYHKYLKPLMGAGAAKARL